MDEPTDSTGSTIASDDTSPSVGSTIDSPTPAQIAAQAWAAAMQQRIKPCPMPPWDEALWFDSIQVYTGTLVAGTELALVPADPMRVALLLSVNGPQLPPSQGIVTNPTNFTFNTMAGTGQLAGVIGTLGQTSNPADCVHWKPDAPKAPANGFGLSSLPGYAPIVILQKDFGTLCSGPWTAFSSNTGYPVTAVGVRMKDWPR